MNECFLSIKNKKSIIDKIYPLHTRNRGVKSSSPYIDRFKKMHFFPSSCKPSQFTGLLPGELQTNIDDYNLQRPAYFCLFYNEHFLNGCDLSYLWCVTCTRFYVAKLCFKMSEAEMKIFTFD